MPSFLGMKDFVKDFDLGKVFAVRLRRPTKNGRTQPRRSSTTTHHDGDYSIPADIPMHPGSLPRDPGLQVSINISSATSSPGNSSARKASDMAQTFLPVVHAVAGAIPLAGPPMQATIGGLLSILQAIDRRGQNKADLERLTSRLHRLSSHLCNAPTAQDPSEQYRRDSIIRMLQDISAQVTQLYNRGLAYTSVTQAIIGCSSEIDRYLADYSLSSQMQIQHEIHEVRKTQQRQQEMLMRIESVFFPGQSSVGPIVTIGFVKLVDATDHSHAIPIDVCDSFERFKGQLQLLFRRDSTEARIQRWYMEQGQYDLCIDDDKQVTRLTSHEWPSIEAGTTIVMRVVFEQEMHPRVNYECHFCGADNDIGAGHIMHSFQRQAGSSINCRVCKRRFQISRGSPSAKRSTQPSNIDSVPRTDAEMRLVRNFHVQQMEEERFERRFRELEELFRELEELRLFRFREEREREEERRRELEELLMLLLNSLAVNEEVRDFNAGGASATAYSHKNEFLGDGTISPQPSLVSPSHDAEYGYNRIEEIEEDSNDDYTEEDGTEGSDDVLPADDGEDCEEWEDCEDGEDHGETKFYGEL